MTDHFVNGNSITPPYPEGMEKAVFGMGCFGGQKDCSGKRPAFIQRPSAMQEALQTIQHILKYAKILRVIPKLF